MFYTISMSFFKLFKKLNKGKFVKTCFLFLNYKELYVHIYGNKKIACTITATSAYFAITQCGTISKFQIILLAYCAVKV